MLIGLLICIQIQFSKRPQIISLDLLCFEGPNLFYTNLKRAKVRGSQHCVEECVWKNGNSWEKEDIVFLKSPGRKEIHIWRHNKCNLALVWEVDYILFTHLESCFKLGEKLCSLTNQFPGSQPKMRPPTYALEPESGLDFDRKLLSKSIWSI